jgi:hypothetical protein
VVNLSYLACRTASALADKQPLNFGQHHVQFLARPNVPHDWGAGYFLIAPKKLFFAQTFFHGGNMKPLTQSDTVHRRHDRPISKWHTRQLDLTTTSEP